MRFSFGRLFVLATTSILLSSCSWLPFFGNDDDELLEEVDSLPPPSSTQIEPESVAPPEAEEVVIETKEESVIPTPSNLTLKTDGGWEVDNPTASLPSRQDLQPTLPLPSSSSESTNQGSQPITVQP